MKVLKWLDDNFELSILVVLLTFISVIMMLQIVMRYVFGSALSWAEEFTRYCFVWSAFLGISFSIKKGIMLNIDMVINKFPEKVTKIINILIQLSVLIFFVFLFYHSIDVVMGIAESNQTSPAIGLPMEYVYLSSLVGFLLSSFRTLQNIIMMIKDFIKEPSIAQEGGNN